MTAATIPIKQDWSKQNQHIDQCLEKTRRALNVLEALGMSVLMIHVEHRNPNIWIANSSKCSQLHGAPACRRNGPNGHETVWVAALEGCQIQWVVRGH